MSASSSKEGTPRRGPELRGPAGAHPRTEKPKNTGKTVLRLLSTLSKSLPSLIAAVLLMAVSAFAGILGTFYLKPLINGLVQGAALSGLARSLAVMAAVYGAGALSSYLGSRLMVGIAQNTSNRIRATLFNHLQDLPLSYFDAHTHGELMSRFTNDVDNVNLALEQSLSQAIISLITIAGAFVMMLVLSPVLTLSVVLMLAVMLFVVKTVGSKSSAHFRGQQKALGELNGYIEEMIGGQKVVKIFNREQDCCDAFEQKNEEFRLASTDAQTFAGILMPILGNLSYINYAVTAMLGALLGISGMMDLGTIAAFLQYTRSFAQPITQISNQMNLLLSALAGAERIFEVMDAPPEKDEGKTVLVLARRLQNGQLEAVPGDPFADFETSFVPAGQSAAANGGPAGAPADGPANGAPILAWSSPQPEGPAVLTPLRGDVRFHDVVFGYTEKDVLHRISLFAKPGQKIAFVGSTGAGKTTITNLLNRFYEIRSGTITYDGIDIRDIRKGHLRRTLGMVLQDVHLFHGTIRDNIRYGKPDATDDEITRAARIASAHSFITRLPNGYDTVLAQDGVNLSQGQRQLLSIARAAVADPPVLILDEATSSIDTRTERLIERGMDRLMHGRTTFVIAHRLSTVRNANAIMVLEQGGIVERGSHEDLIAARGRYFELYTGAAELS